MPSKPRFKDTGKSSFWGSFVYDRIVPQDHFLVALEKMFDWSDMSRLLLQAYQGQGLRGRPPYDPVQIFKILFVSYLYGASERQVEDLVNYHLLVKCFVGLAVDERAPDHSTLTVFKNRYLETGQWEPLRSCFDQMIKQAVAHGVELGDLQLLDSTHTQADVNAEKEAQRRSQGEPPRDPDASVVDKGQREVVEPDGRRVTKRIRHSGYKAHVSTNAKTGVITSFTVTTGNRADNKQFPALHAHDQALGLATRAYGGDRAYDDTELYERLAAHGQEIGIIRWAQRPALFSHPEEGCQQRALAGTGGLTPVSAGSGATLAGGTRLWSGQAEAWVWALPLCGIASLPNPGPFHAAGKQQQASGQGTDRHHLPSPSQRAAGRTTATSICQSTLGVVRLKGEWMRQERFIGSL